MPVVHGGNVLLKDYILAPDGKLTEGPYTLHMQMDSNLVLYDNRNPIWASNTQHKGRSCYLIMQSDGNAVIYDGEGRAIWSSGTDTR
jgi:hypothetical protein